MMVNAKQLAQLHDDMLAQEMRILGMAERLGELRIRMMREKGTETLEKAAKLAGELALEAREYQEWLEDQRSQAGE